MGTRTGYRWILTLALALLCVGFASVAGAMAKEFPYTLEPVLSLTGDCSTTPKVDEVEDPDCPYPPLPDRPSGRFDRPFSVAVDDWGNLYVASRSGDGTAGRIDIFDDEGHFISELADPNGPQSIAVDGEGNLYAYERQVGLGDDPDVVRYPPSTYNPAAGEIEYDGTRVTVTVDLNFVFNGLAIDRRDPADPADDRLFIAEDERIREYGSAKEGNGLKATIEPPGLNAATWATVDSQRRRLYTTHCKEGLNKCVVWVLEADAPYGFLKEIDGSTTPAGKFFSNQGRISLAVDETNGHLFVGDLAAGDDIYEFDESYELASTFTVPDKQVPGSVQSAVADNPKDPDPEDKNPADNYRHLFVPLSPTSGNVLAFEPPDAGPPEIEGEAAANIGESEAEVEATVEPNDLDTEYRIEYTLFEDTGYTEAILAGTGTIPGTSAPKRVSALLTGLEPGTAYRFRVVAENEAGEAEPPGEAAFATYDDADPAPDPGACSNLALRSGPSAGLPDCRAYELVTPPDTNGRPPRGAGYEGDRFGAVQAAPAGAAVSFEILSGTLPGTEATGGFHGDPYLSTRSATGWSSALAGPTGAQASKPLPGSFSPDQGYSFWAAEGEGSAVVEGRRTTYVRYPDGHSELVGRGSLDSDPLAVGRLITEGGTHVIFQTHTFSGAVPVKLEPDAPEAGITAVYDRTSDEITHVVSLLPGEVTPTEDASYAGASADGEGIAFEIGTTLYLRVGNEVTHEIGTGVTFAGVSDGGGRVFYVEEGDLKAFDVATEEVIVFADTAAPVVPVNVAPQGTRAYFVSETAISESGENPNGESAQAGEQNLYLSEEGQIDFVATVTERDVEGGENEGTGVQFDGLGLWTVALAKQQPGIDPSRLTPDGGVLVFHSRADLAGYDPGEFPQIYRYDHVAGRLHCISCPPTMTPATGGAALQSLGSQEDLAPLSPFGFVPALRPDGDRAFFESTEALVSDDTDGLRDVYEWEEEGVGSCKREGGCVYLISSGQSAGKDYLFGHSQSGDDVFIHTADVLVPGDQATTSIYDARVGGGFAATAPVACGDEGSCRPAPTPPPAPQSSPLPKSGNFVPPKKCPRGKRKVKRQGRWVCVKKHKKQRKAQAQRGASR